jgi:predicted acyl esterase
MRPSFSRVLPFLLITVLVSTSALLSGCDLLSRDTPLTFLEDDPAIRAHPDYPVVVQDVDELEDQIVIERDVWITVRDGTRLSANVFRPRSEGQYPVVMALTAYDKNKGPDLYPKLLRNALKDDFDLGKFAVSPWTAWEGPDPAYWVSQGYAVVYLDSRGFASSEGDPGTASVQDRDDFYDAIEWAGTQAWSNGNVGTNGVSYLAIAQWVAASGNPPHLKAIVPWEGQSDAYREVLYHGGIPETAFTGFWIRKVRSGANGSPLPPPFIFKLAHKRPAFMRWVQSRPNALSGIDLPQIQAPALVAATWSDQGLHTRGSFEGFKQISSEHKWLYTHGRQKWGVYYSDDALRTQTEFYDHFLKGEDNGFDRHPAVRLEVRESLEEYKVRFEEDWPIPDTDYRELYLHGDSMEMGNVAPISSTEIRYDSETESAVFIHTFAEDTELSGNMKLKLWVSIEEGDDMDLFVSVDKLNAAGDVVHFYAKMGYTKGPVAMGWLRVSQRALDTERSTPAQPWLLHDKSLPVEQGDVIPVEIEILPSSTLFRGGESLRLTVQGREFFDHPSLGHHYAVNRGAHYIHSGPGQESFLLVPVIPPQDPQAR